MWFLSLSFPGTDINPVVCLHRVVVRNTFLRGWFGLSVFQHLVGTELWKLSSQRLLFGFWNRNILKYWLCYSFISLFYLKRYSLSKIKFFATNINTWTRLQFCLEASSSYCHFREKEKGKKRRKTKERKHTTNEEAIGDRSACTSWMQVITKSLSFHWLWKSFHKVQRTGRG